ncbi:hypothetical protein BC941DRAFT_455684 [Chlamydoabsidia padenii]|nr:hypothetical protein BC941DRAFT_455684 [Chlamydoabsidia padenii]
MRTERVPEKCTIQIPPYQTENEIATRNPTLLSQQQRLVPFHAGQQHRSEDLQGQQTQQSQPQRTQQLQQQLTQSIPSQSSHHLQQHHSLSPKHDPNPSAQSPTHTQQSGDPSKVSDTSRGVPPTTDRKDKASSSSPSTGRNKLNEGTQSSTLGSKVKSTPEPVSLSRRSRRPRENVDNCRLFVGGLTAGATKEELLARFKNYGPIVEVTKRLDARYGFVEYIDRYSACIARDMEDDKSFQGDRLRVQFSKPRHHIPSTINREETIYFGWEAYDRHSPSYENNDSDDDRRYRHSTGHRRHTSPKRDDHSNKKSRIDSSATSDRTYRSRHDASPRNDDTDQYQREYKHDSRAISRNHHSPTTATKDTKYSHKRPHDSIDDRTDSKRMDDRNTTNETRGTSAGTSNTAAMGSVDTNNNSNGGGGLAQKNSDPRLLMQAHTYTTNIATYTIA